MTDGLVFSANTDHEWPAEGLSRIPDWVYTDETIYQREVERIFHGRTWNYVALEAEIANPGDFIRSNVGPTPVVVARDQDGAIHVVENRCAHRAAEFCRELSGTVKEFVCPYHQWTYELNGRLRSVPFRRGVAGKGGMPADFEPARHGLRRLSCHHASRGRICVLCRGYGAARGLSRPGYPARIRGDLRRQAVARARSLSPYAAGQLEALS